nr:hypothetical protein [Tanacetum cinerariifolium]
MLYKIMKKSPVMVDVARRRRLGAWLRACRNYRRWNRKDVKNGKMKKIRQKPHCGKYYGVTSRMSYAIINAYYRRFVADEALRRNVPQSYAVKYLLLKNIDAD